MTETALAKLDQWFELLVEDCQTILDRTKGQVGEALYRGKHALGIRVLDEKRLDGRTQAELAKRLGISQQTISDAKRFAEQNPDITLYISSRFTNGVGKLPSWRREVAQLLPRGQPSFVPVAKNSIRNEGVLEGDFREADHEEESVHLILTDPPYSNLELWHDLGSLAQRVLVDGGWLVAYTGHVFLPDVLDILRQYLNYHWILALKFGTKGPLMFQRHVFVSWRPIVVFYKPPLQDMWIQDFFQGPGTEKTHHPWQQDLQTFRTLIDQFSQPGQIVMDPMAGAGTVAEACNLEPKRRCIAYEVNKLASC